MAWYSGIGGGDGSGEAYARPVSSRPWYSFSQPAAQGWGGSGMDNPTPNQTILYNAAPTLVDRQLGNWLAPNHMSPLHQYIDAQAPQMQKDWAIASASDPSLQYIDYQKQHYGDLLTGFGNLSASQRGENPLAFGGGVAGRTVFR